ncbi:MAG: YjbE family putative metal transport protein [Methanobacterium sp.]|nr:YjbE family putative metal transport protein [Methanobacterium sp.]
MVIALACRSLPPGQMRKAIVIGMSGAILLRVYLTTVVAYLMDVPCLKLVGAVALVVIAIKLMAEDDHKDKVGEGRDNTDRQKLDLWSAVFVVIIADLVMSLDNVVALAAVANGSFWVLLIGLMLSVPLLMFGSLIVAALLKRYPLLIPAGAALLGWVAGDIAVGDPMISDWVSVQAPALGVVLPFIGVVFVLVESRIVDRDRKAAAWAGGGDVAGGGRGTRASAAGAWG